MRTCFGASKSSFDQLYVYSLKSLRLFRIHVYTLYTDAFVNIPCSLQSWTNNWFNLMSRRGSDLPIPDIPSSLKRMYRNTSYTHEPVGCFFLRPRLRLLRRTTNHETIISTLHHIKIRISLFGVLKCLWAFVSLFGRFLFHSFSAFLSRF